MVAEPQFMAISLAHELKPPVYIFLPICLLTARHTQIVCWPIEPQNSAQ